MPVNIVDKYQYFQVSSWVDPNTGNFARVNADGSLNVSLSGSSVVTNQTLMRATAADPAPAEGSYTTASVNLQSYQRVIARQSGSWTVSLSTNAVVLGTSSNNIGVVSISGTIAASSVNFGAGDAGLSAGAINFATSGSNAVVAASTGRAIRIYKLFFKTMAQTNLTFWSGTAGAFTGAMTFGPSEGMVLDFSGDPWFTVNTSHPFVMSSSNAVQVSGQVQYKYV
jgi:hypothetical protein